MQETTDVAALLGEAQRAKSVGDQSRTADLLIRAIEAGQNGALPRGAYIELCTALCLSARYEDAVRWTAVAQTKIPKNPTLYNLRGVAFRRLGRGDEALACFRESQKLDGKSVAPLVNSGNVYLDQHEGQKAVEAFTKVVRLTPRTAEHQRLLGVAYRQVGDLAKARRQFELARQLAPDVADAWIDIAHVCAETGEKQTGIDMLDKAIARVGPTEQLLKAKLAYLRHCGLRDDAAALLKELVAATPDKAWLQLQMGRTLAPYDRPAANRHYQRALELAPDDKDIVVEFADSLDRTRGPQEPQNIAASYALAQRRLQLGGDLITNARTLRNLLVRSADFPAAAKLGTFEQLGEYWSRMGFETALHLMMAQATTPDHRRLLVEWHRRWGRGVDRNASQSPLTRPPAVVGRARIRVGLMSSDLRSHPVGYFAAPLIHSLDRNRFEVACYSWNSRENDEVQQSFTRAADIFRHHPQISDRDAAQLIADDDCDVLFELGGSTDMNKIRTMAWRPAARQASWLGYPHSCGLESIDRILTDPFITPEDPALLIEKPLELAHSWVAFDRPGFGHMPDIDPTTPEEREGFVTFGTANNPHKYNAGLIATWARVVASVPGSRFLFVRPEGAVPAFRANVERAFAEQGVGPERIAYVPVRGAHMPHYNRIDVALDAFPQTGGTTTCETLYMGVPVISLIGEAFFERLSHSNLNNAGLGELCVRTVDEYVAKAGEIARATAWRGELRRTMRQRLKDHPLGQPQLFVKDFEDAVIRWMDEPRP